MAKVKAKFAFRTHPVDAPMEHELFRYRMDDPRVIEYEDAPVFMDLECHETNYTAARTVQVYQRGWPKAIIFDTNDFDLETIWQSIKDQHIVVHYMGMEGHMFSNDRGSDIFPFEKWDDTFLLARLALPGKVESFGLDAIARYIHKYDYYAEYAIELGYVGEEVKDFKKSMQRSFLNSPKSDKMNMPLHLQQIVYSAYDVMVMPDIYDAIKSAKEEWVYQLDQKVIPYITHYSHRGMPVNQSRWDAAWIRAQEHIDHATEILGSTLNVNSYIQVRALLESSESDDTYLAKVIQQDGKHATTAKAIREKRKFIKQQTFLNKFVAPDRRVKGFHFPGTISGRMQCDEQNMLQIPRELKDVFGFEDTNDKWIVHCDYAALELRMLCVILGDPVLEKLFRDGVDLHKYAASKIYGMPIEDVPKYPHRFVGKTGNFGLGYGAGVGRFRDMCVKNAGLWLSESDAAMIVRGWKSLYPEVKKWHAANGRSPDNMDVTLGGRVYKAKLYTDLNAVKIQGSSAEVFKLAIYYESLRDAPIMNAIHDSMLQEYDSFEEAKVAGEKLYRSMTKAWFEITSMAKITDLAMPATVDIGKNWGDIEADPGDELQPVHHFDYPGTYEDYLSWKDEVC